MLRLQCKRIVPPALALTLAVTVLLAPAPSIDAADHGDAPFASLDRAAEITDVYAFLDPNDNSKLVLGLGIHGFIPPGENNNFSPFDPNVRYRFEIETTGDATPDQFVEVMFTPRTAVNQPQIATVNLPFGDTFTAPTTLPSATAATAPAPVVTTDPATGASFFAGLRDDPFFFDIPAELLYRASRVASPPDGSGIDPSVFNRGRDTFAGYNIVMIVVSIPTSYFRLKRTAGNPGGDEIGVSAATQRRENTVISRNGVTTFGRFRNVDRMGVPGVNTVFIPFLRKDEYNRSTPADDGRLRFASDIIKSLQDLKTEAAGINFLANLVVFRGDILRLKLSVPNSGSGGGNNVEGGFPNGRRPADDVIDIIVTIVNNFQPVNGPGTTAVDNVNGNDVPFRNTFPFFADPQQPRAAGTIDDNTRN
ncbi:MAG TPA: DUF4331 family protein [Blastocatellia bacterium]|nr:DUF4331 family protein [Blastocatellia bacterium]